MGILSFNTGKEIGTNSPSQDHLWALVMLGHSKIRGKREGLPYSEMCYSSKDTMAESLGIPVAAHVEVGIGINT